MTALALRQAVAALVALLSVCWGRPVHAHTVYLNFSNGDERIALAERDDATENRSVLCEANPYQRWSLAEDCGNRETCRDEIVALVREYWQDFDLQFTLTRPRADFAMVMIGPTSGTCEFGAQGIADIDCANQVAGNVAFAFDCNGPTSVCAGVISHELGHTFGLDHTTDSTDIMNGGIFEGKTIAFQNRWLPVASSAVCGASSQNSHLQLERVLGPAGNAYMSEAGCQISGVTTRRSCPRVLCFSLLAVALLARRQVRRVGADGSNFGVTGYVSAKA